MAGWLLWLWHGAPALNNLLLLSAISLSVGSLVWLILARVWLNRTGFELRRVWLPYPYGAVGLAVVLVGLVTVDRWGGHVLMGRMEAFDALTFPACGVVALTLLAHLVEYAVGSRCWDSNAQPLYDLVGTRSTPSAGFHLQQASIVAGGGFVLAWAVLSWRAGLGAVPRFNCGHTPINSGSCLCSQSSVASQH